MSAPNEVTPTVDHLYDAVLTAVDDTAGTGRAALLHGLAARLTRYADCLDNDPCYVAGLRVVREVLDVVADRETVPAARLDALTPDDVVDLYAAHVEPAVDGIEGALLDPDQ